MLNNFLKNSQNFKCVRVENETTNVMGSLEEASNEDITEFSPTSQPHFVTLLDF